MRSTLLHPTTPSVSYSDGFASRTRRFSTRPVVMVVDDEESVREVLRVGLSRCGFTVLQAGGGEEAVELYRARGQTIDVVVLDVRMPGMDGAETLAALRLLDPSVRVFFMTADPGRYTPEDLLRRGARRVLAKPIRFDQLATELGKELGDRTGDDGCRATGMRTDLLPPAGSRVSHAGTGHGDGREVFADGSRVRTIDPHTAELLDGIAHEFRNPLTAIRFGLSILEQSNSPGRQARTLEMLHREVDLIARLTDDLAMGALVTRGEVHLRKEQVDVRAALAFALESGRLLVLAAGHTFAVQLPPEPLMVEVDTDRFAQVVTNLLGNAAKYTEAGGHVEVGVTRNGSDVLLWVKDTGLGIPAHMLDSVFEPFVRVRAVEGRSRRGIGVGLAVVRRVVEAHGGMVWAESAGPGRGSTFTVRLPLAEEAPTSSLADEGG